MEETKTDNKTSVSPKNHFWVWIVVALATTVSTIALWGDSQKDRLITNYKEDKEKCEEIVEKKDSIITKKTYEIDTLRSALYISQSNSIDKYLEYDSRMKEINNKLNRENSELIKMNKIRQENINKLTKLRKELKN